MPVPRVRGTDTHRYFAGLSEDLDPFVLPQKAPDEEWKPKYTADGVLEFNPPSHYIQADDAIQRLTDFAAAAPVEPADQALVHRAAHLLDSVNSGAPDAPVSGDTSFLWRTLYVLDRSDHFSGGTAFDSYLVAATRIANELRRRMQALADGTTNPWLDLAASAPYVLPQDMAVLRGFPNLLRNDDERELQFELAPGPFIGNSISARVLLLSLNPGFDERDLVDERSQPLQGLIWAALRQSPSAVFHPLLEDVASASGSRWWQRHLGPLLDRVPRKSVIEGLANVEWFPYHSKRFQRIACVVPSQRYTFTTVRDAVARGAVVVITRSASLWLQSVPALSEPGIIVLKNPQNPSVSPGNMEPAEFDRIVAALTP